MPKTQNYRIVYLRPGPARTPEETRENNRGEAAPGPGAGPGEGRQPLLGAYSSQPSDLDPGPGPRSRSRSRSPIPAHLPGRCATPQCPAVPLTSGAEPPPPARPAPLLSSRATARTRRSQPIGCRAWVEAANGRLGAGLKGGAVDPKGTQPCLRGVRAYLLLPFLRCRFLR